MHNLQRSIERGIETSTHIFSYPQLTANVKPAGHTLHQFLRKSVLYRTCKRALDIAVAIAGLFLLLLLLPVLSLLIFVEDGGPIFYVQPRLGLHGRPFPLYKLRTMLPDAHDHFARYPAMRSAWLRHGKLRNDPRVTRIGRFLRRSSLDELPQMLNILRGEMSLVGPRAIQFSEISAFGELSTLRQMVKPGLTGLWQVSGRSQVDYTQRCVLDCMYVMECSLWADMHILIQTLPTVVLGEGAY